MASNFRLDELIRRYPPREKKQKKAPRAAPRPRISSNFVGIAHPPAAAASGPIIWSRFPAGTPPPQAGC